MKLSQIMQRVDIISNACDFNMEVADICFDSRRCTPGSVFVAIKGYESNGNDYIPEALKKGAQAVITDIEPEDHRVPHVVVRNARIALAEMSANFFDQPQRGMKLIGVTGTNGKTTVASLIKAVLDESGAKCGLIGTNGHMVGTKFIATDRTTPESYEIFKLLSMMRDEGCKYAVMEVSSHSLVLERVHGLDFEAAVFTNLTQDHLDFHKDMEQYLEAKARLFSCCKTAVINYDDEAGRRLIEDRNCYKITYSTRDNAASVVAKNIQLKANRVEFEAVSVGNINRVTLGIPGLFSVYNALAAIGCCMALQVDLPAIVQGLAAADGVKGRAEVVEVPADYTVLIDYAHSPDSMKNILRAVREFAKGRVIGLFGCGGNRDRVKRPIMGNVGASNTDVAIITSDNPRSEDPRAIIDDIIPGTIGTKSELHIITDRVEAIRFALTIARPGDVVVLMGKGHETYQEVAGKKLHLDEREVIKEFFNQ